MTDLNLDPWMDRIESEVKDAQGLRQVQGVADLALIKDGQIVPPSPSVCVIPITENAESEVAGVTGVVHQPVGEVVGIVSCIQNVRDRTGRQAHNDLRALRRALKDALIGWTPDPEVDLVKFMRGDLYINYEHTLLWLDRYVATYHEYYT